MPPSHRASTLPELLPPWAASLCADVRPRRIGTADLVTRLREALESGELAPGATLATSRGLAEQLGVSRSTVVAAYRQLMLEGWLQGRGRHGTVVAHRLGSTSASSRGKGPSLLKRRGPTDPPVVPAHLDWRLGQSSAVRLPPSAWERASRYSGRFPPPIGYGDPAGAPALRESIARALTRLRGLQIDARQVLVTQGAAQALDLIIDGLVMPGDVCAVENPGYPRVTELLQRRGAALCPVPVDEQGLVVPSAFAGTRAPALLHLTPGHQYPLGVRLSAERRRELIASARRHGSLLVENEYDHEFVHSGPHHAPLLSAAPERVLLVGTFAKAISPSMRLGYIVAQPDTIARLAALVEHSRRHVSWPGQLAMAWLLDSGEFDRHLRRVRRQSARLAEQLMHALAPSRELLQPVGLAGGQHVFLRTDSALAASRLKRAVSSQGVMLDPIEAYAAGSTGWHGLLMSYAQMRQQDMDAAVTLLQAAMTRALSHGGPAS